MTTDPLNGIWVMDEVGRFATRGTDIAGKWVRLHFNAGTSVWVCDHAEPVIWFSGVFLDSARSLRRQALDWRKRALAAGDITEAEPDTGFFGPWFVEPDGQEVKLACANGYWVWRLTGRTSDTNPGPSTLHEAVWPD